MAKAAAKFAFTPAPGRLIVESLEMGEKTDSGLYLPESAKERPQLAKVVAYTPGRNDDGNSKDPICKVGDTIFHKKWVDETVRIEGGDFLILREEDILAVKN